MTPIWGALRSATWPAKSSLKSSAQLSMGPPGLLGVVPEGVRVVPAGQHADVARRPFHPVSVLVQPEVPEWRVALPGIGLRGEPPGLGEVGDLLPFRDALGVDGLPHLGGDHHVHVVEVAFRHLVLVVLVQHLPDHRAVAEGLAANREPEVLRRLALDLVDDADREADGADPLAAAGDVGESPRKRPRRRDLGGVAQELAARPPAPMHVLDAHFLASLGLSSQKFHGAKIP